VASVAKTTFRYKEVHLNEVYGCAYTPYLGYQKDLKDFIANEQNRINNVTDELELDYDDGFDFER